MGDSDRVASGVNDEPPSPQAIRLRCPRCRYDLRSNVLEGEDRWTESCPIEGRCPECGLLFEWSEVFNPTLRPPTWSVEFASRGRFPLAVMGTWFCSAFVPWRFWKRLWMSLPVRSGRLAVYVATILILPLWILTLLGSAGFALLQWRSIQDEIAGLAFRQTTPHAALSGTLAASGDACWPGLFVTGWSFAGVQERSSWYINGGPSVEQHVRLWEHLLAGGPPQPDRSATGFVLHACLLPTSMRPGTNLVGSPASQWVSVPPPAEQAGAWVGAARRFDRMILSPLAEPAVAERILRSSGSVGELLRTGGRGTSLRLACELLLPSATLLAIIQILTGAGVYLVLPATRRRAKVSWAHVGRIAAYGAWIAVLPGVVPLAAGMLWSIRTARFSPRTTGVMTLGSLSVSHDTVATIVFASAILAIPVLLLIWWSLAARHYLKVPHPWGVGAAQAIIGSGAALLLYLAARGWL